MIETGSGDEYCRGDVHYLEVLDYLHRELKPDFYLEIGVGSGRSMALSRCNAIGIDPNPDCRNLMDDRVTIFTETSQYFFGHWDNAFSFDLAFIDGSHLIQDVISDFVWVQKCMKPHGVIAIHDIFPNNEAQALRVRKTVNWAGDVWKAPAILKKTCPHLDMLMVDCYPTGMLLIGNGFNTPVGHYQINLDQNGLQEAIYRAGSVRSFGRPFADFINRAKARRNA